MKLNTYLHYNGNCEAALKFYERVLGAKIVMMMRYGESPMGEQCAKDFSDKIMHARIVIGQDILMASDAPPDRFNGQAGFTINVGVTSTEEADRLFAALSEKGSVTMPIGETFWAHRFGMLTDQFGVMWMVNYEKTPN